MTAAKDLKQYYLILLATLLLLIISIALSAALVEHKHDQWSDLLTTTVRVDNQLSLRVPPEHIRADDSDSSAVLFKLQGMEQIQDSSLIVLRPASGEVQSLAQACHYVAQELALGTEVFKISIGSVTPARLGKQPARLALVQLIKDARQGLGMELAVLFAHDALGSPRILALKPSRSLSLPVAKALLVKIAESARLY